MRPMVSNKFQYQSNVYSLGESGFYSWSQRFNYVYRSFQRIDDVGIFLLALLFRNDLPQHLLMKLKREFTHRFQV